MDSVATEQSPLPIAGFVVGRDEDAFLGEGWHERELRGTDGVAYRAVAERATFRLTLAPGGATRIRLLLTAPVALLGEPYRGRLLLEGLQIGSIEIDTDNWVLRRFDLPASMHGKLDFALCSETFFIPAERIDSSRDTRHIACYVGAVLSSRAD